MNTVPSVRFVYEVSTRDAHKEAVIRNFCAAARSILDLPSTIEICIAQLNPHLYGGIQLDWRFKNRLKLNSTLSIIELPIVLTHELIHMQQVHCGVLSVTRHGHVVWNGVTYDTENLSYEEYRKLPWEAEVTRIETPTLNSILKTANHLLTNTPT